MDSLARLLAFFNVADNSSFLRVVGTVVVIAILVSQALEQFVPVLCGFAAALGLSIAECG